MRFDHVGVFTYSHEEGTTAYDFKDDVPAATKKRRQSRLMARQRQLVRDRQKARIGSQRVRLVVDGPSHEHELVLRGRLQGQAPDDRFVGLPDRLRPSTIAPGNFIDVEIVDAQGYDLIARPV